MAKAVWDDRLLTREHALELVAEWPIVLVHYRGEDSVHLHCAAAPHGGDGRKACYQSVGRFLGGYRTDLDELIAGVVRHAVMAHELDTGRREGGRTEDGDDCGRLGDLRPLREPRHNGDRPFDKALDRERGGGLEGGDAA